MHPFALLAMLITSILVHLGLIRGANTLTNLIPTLFEALDVVSREMIGFIPAVSRNNTVDRAAVNQTINIPVVGAITAGNVTAGTTPPDDGDATPGNTTMTITKSRYAPVRWNGEEQKAVGHSGLYNVVLAQQFAQALRTLCNEIEVDLGALHTKASRAVGVYNAVPFVTAGNFLDFANSHKALDDNGAPFADRQMVLGGAPTANLRGVQNSLFKVNEAGTEALLRQGILGRVEGFDIHNSHAIKKSVTVGTNSGATTDTTGYAVGSTTITLAAAGTGTVIVGDIVTFTGDTNQYVIAGAGTAGAAVGSGGTIVLAEPGLRKALAASGITMTTVAACDRHMVFSRSSIQLATRLPALPDGGDMADDRMTITDPISGLSFEVSIYRQYRRVKYEVAISWGMQVVAPRHCMLLLSTAS